MSIIPKSDGKSKPATNEVFSAVLSDSILLEAIYNPKTKSTQFVTFKKGRTEVTDVYHDEATGITYTPKNNTFILHGNLTLPSRMEETGDPRDLLLDIQTFIHKYVDLDPGFEELSARYVMMTYLFDRFTKIPYLRVIGMCSTGKSRFLKVIKALAYHATYLGSGVTTSTIYRTLEENGNSTLFLDEANFVDSGPTSVLVQILNNGYESDGVVIRSNANTYKPEVYSSFGPKVIASHIPFRDKGLESRFISQVMRETKRNDIPYELPTDTEWIEAQNLRQRLLGFRMMYFQDFSTKNEIPALEKFGFRIREIVAPLYHITGDTCISPNVTRLLTLMRENTVANNQFSDEGMVVKAVLAMANDASTVPVVDIVQKTEEMFDFKLSNRRTSDILRTLGFMSQKQNRGLAYHLRSVDLVSLADQYGLFFMKETKGSNNELNPVQQ